MRKVFGTIPHLKIALISSALFFSFQLSSYAADVTLHWDANYPWLLDGYNVYYKTGSLGEPYDGTDADQGPSPITVPIGDLADSDNPEYTLTGLTDGVAYFFVVTAYDIDEVESDYSNEVSNDITTPEPTLGGEGGGDGWCFIATAAFGSNMDRHVKILSAFMDRPSSPQVHHPLSFDCTQDRSRH